MGTGIILQETEARGTYQVEVERERFLKILDVLKEDSKHLCEVIGYAKDAKQIFLLRDDKILRFEYAETIDYCQDIKVDETTLFVVDAFVQEKK